MKDLSTRLYVKFRRLTWEALEVDLHIPKAISRQYHEHLAFIISDQALEIGKMVMQELKREVTKMHGTGISVLMCGRYITNGRPQNPRQTN